MDIITLLESITLLSVFKLLIICLLFVYAIFGFLIMQQIMAMSRAVNLKDDFVMKVLGAAHFAAAILMLIISIIVL